MNTAKEYHPHANIYVCGILPDPDEPDTYDAINTFSENQATRKSISFIRLDSLKHVKNCFRDNRHPNRRGTGEMVKRMKTALGYEFRTPLNTQTRDTRSRQNQNEQKPEKPVAGALLQPIKQQKTRAKHCGANVV